LETAPNTEDDESVFLEALLYNPPDRLILPAEDGFPSVDFSFEDPTWREYRIWEGYLDASLLLLDQILKKRPNSRGLIFPAMFNLRHAIEVALKWHIRYAGGVVPAHAGHKLNVLIDAFRQTAHGLDENTTYISEYIFDLISELSEIDPRSITFRYSTALDGSPVPISNEPWDLRRLHFTVGYLSIWFDHLSGYIDMSNEEYQAMLREIDGRC
jgi:hypothetical protein